MSKNQEQRIIGVDVHPYCIAVAAFNLKKEKLWQHDRIEMCDLKQWLFKNIRTTDTLIVEACNNSFEFARIVSEFGAQCLVLNSIQVGQIGKAYCKTDKEDCVKIAKIYLSGLSDTVWQPDQRTTLRREVLKKYQQSNKAVTKCKNMLRSYLTEHAILKPNTFSLYSEKGRSWLKEIYKWDFIQLELIDLMYDDLFHAVKSKKKLKNIIARDVFNDSKTLSLMKLCGIRSITAFAMVAAIGDINRFSNPKKLAAY